MTFLSGNWLARFSLADPVRYQLLFQRTIPDFTPTPSSYSLAQEAYERDFAALRRLGLSRQRDLDLVTGVISGLVAQQLTNEPDSDRWLRLLDDAVDMLMHHVSSAGHAPVLGSFSTFPPAVCAVVLFCVHPKKMEPEDESVFTSPRWTRPFWPPTWPCLGSSR